MLQEKKDLIKSKLVSLFGIEDGAKRYIYIEKSIEEFLKIYPPKDKLKNRYEAIKSTVFAICYPDNIYEYDEYTLVTLNNFLQAIYPSIKGIHILPERKMSHNDIWPQDYFDVLGKKMSGEFIKLLIKKKVVNKEVHLIIDIEERKEDIYKTIFIPFLDEKKISVDNKILDDLYKPLQNAFNSHFNDGGFSQVGRDIIDPRFGDISNLNKLSNKYKIMLDYVVNHVDIDTPYLEDYRNGKNDGSAFLIISPDEYQEYKQNGSIAKTFRPRPYPLFTGLRKYPEGGYDKNIELLIDKVDGVSKEVIEFLAIYYKVENDQGLTSKDKRVINSFIKWLADNNIDSQRLFIESDIQPRQYTINSKNVKSFLDFCTIIGLSKAQIDTYLDSDELLGEVFYIYTTFSESQVDINPLSSSGFEMIIDDLFHLLSSGDIAMMRMDAIKYLWKEIGKSNFNMKEGNELIDVIRLILEWASPQLLPLDEVNSPDSVVYDMGKNGGFYYLFGQVNAVAIAFENENITPLTKLSKMMKERRAKDLVLFTMLSTHDGRSVQGLGVDLVDGHVSVQEFCDLKDLIEANGGFVKYRSVKSGEIPAQTYQKVAEEMGWREALQIALFEEESDILKLKNIKRENVISIISEMEDIEVEVLNDSPIVEYLLNWMIEGKTPYELCSTSRSAFRVIQSEKEDADRFFLAQVYCMTMGQVVPAIYLNDLLALPNDIIGFNESGKPRDLNRKKTNMERIDLNNKFSDRYIKKINKFISLWNNHKAFFPGSECFEYIALNHNCFLHHHYHNKTHSLIIGNVSSKETIIDLDLSVLKASPGPGNQKWKDLLSGKEYVNNEIIEIKLNKWGVIWLS